MKILITLFWTFLLFTPSVNTQNVKLQIEGAIQIGNVDEYPIEPGTIRWTGKDFEGWNGFTWVSLSNFQINSIITDIDGNAYHTVRIGSQIWMAENLRTTRYANGDPIPYVEESTIWSGLIIGAYCWYHSEAEDEIPFGKLYNWYAAADTNNVCPSGWHVPTDAEWTTLTNFLGGLNNTGGLMKETGTLHWLSPNTGATNDSGFTGLGGGGRNYNGSGYDFGKRGNYWSASGFSDLGYFRELIYNDADVGVYVTNKRVGLSIRCLKD